MNAQQAKVAAQGIVAPWELLAALNNEMVAQRPSLLAKLSGKLIHHDGEVCKLVSFYGSRVLIQSANGRGKQRFVDLQTLNKDEIAKHLHG
tara:strand:+ start:163 stop:435 length:273 start_codon:yes stop_codon:yes gene_type:complete